LIETEVFPLHEIVARLDRLARKRVLNSVGLSYGEFVLAMAVNEMERPTQAEVGELLDMSKSLVSQRVGGLLAKDFIV
jgi:DNA-binding MarR family transcriptional regulator